MRSFYAKCVVVGSPAFVVKFLEKLMEKCPVNYSVIRNAVCMDPRYMVQNTATAERKMKSLLLYFTQKNQIQEEECDNILLEYSEFVQNIAQESLFEFKNYDLQKMRLDTFLSSFIGSKYSKLWNVFKMVFILSHGQASVERGFSVNKNVEVENLGDNSYIAKRLVCDWVNKIGGLDNVYVTNEMRVSASSAHSKYRTYLEEQRKKEILEQRKRKADEPCEKTLLKEKKARLEMEIKEMEKKAKEFSARAESTKDFSLMHKSNELLKTVCEKQAQLRELDSSAFEKKQKRD